MVLDVNNLLAQECWTQGVEVASMNTWCSRYEEIKWQVWVSDMASVSS